jgi:viroplasmin and RNaseH domain-containing protein
MSFYAVKKGIEPGLYTSWEECAKQIEGFSGAEYKKFKTETEATDYINTKTVMTGKPLDLSVFAYKEDEKGSSTVALASW